MFRRILPNLPLLLLSLICLSLACLSFLQVQSWLDRLVDDGRAEFFTSEVHLRFRIVMGLFSLAFLSRVIADFWRKPGKWRPSTEACGAARQRFRRPRLSRRFWMAVVGCVLLAAVVRLVHLNQPMRYDEAYTYNTYISRGLLAAVSTYESPNNHLLNTFLSWGSVKAFGNSPASLRLPAFLAGILCVPATMLLANRIAGIRAAILAGILVALCSPLIEYSTNGRGYTLLSLWTLLAWLSSLELIRRDNRATRLTLTASIGLGLATIPLMFVPLLMLGTWIGCLWWKSRERIGIARRFGPCFVFGGLISCVAYSPILIVTGPVEFLSNVAARKLDPRPLSGHVLDSLEQGGELLFRDIPGPILAMMFAGLILFVWRLTPLFRFGRASAIVATFACVIPFLILNSSPVARVWLFLLPLLFVACSCGFARVLASIESRTIGILSTCGLVAAIAVWPFINSTLHRSIENSQETGAFPEAEMILTDLKPLLKSTDRIYAVGPSHAQLVYYAERMGIDRHQFPNLREHGVENGAFLICPTEGESSLDETLKTFDVELSRAAIVPLRTYPNLTVFLVQSANK